jgi:hypothetical protein
MWIDQQKTFVCVTATPPFFMLPPQTGCNNTRYTFAVVGKEIFVVWRLNSTKSKKRTMTWQ